MQPAQGSGGRQRNPELRKRLEDALKPSQKVAEKAGRLQGMNKKWFWAAGAAGGLALGVGAHQLRKRRIQRNFKAIKPSVKRPRPRQH